MHVSYFFFICYLTAVLVLTIATWSIDMASRLKLGSIMPWKSSTKRWWRVVNIWFVMRSMCSDESLKTITTFWAWSITLRRSTTVSPIINMIFLSLYPNLPYSSSIPGHRSCSGRRAVWPYLSKGKLLWAWCCSSCSSYCWSCFVSSRTRRCSSR